LSFLHGHFEKLNFYGGVGRGYEGGGRIPLDTILEVDFKPNSILQN